MTSDSPWQPGQSHLAQYTGTRRERQAPPSKPVPPAPTCAHVWGGGTGCTIVCRKCNGTWNGSQTDYYKHIQLIRAKGLATPTTAEVGRISFVPEPIAPIPNPGSSEALALGCRCPVIDNFRGVGRPLNGDTSFVISMLCSLHSLKA